MEISAYQQVECFHRFENAHRRAQLWRFWRQLSGKPLTLLPFAPIYSCLQQRVGHRLGLQEIPLQQIVGSFDKAHLFDRAFRPLSDALRKRWVNMKMLQMAGGWEPIDVHKVGNLYFVEDGHHRVSVARDAGLQVIEANVVEYPLATRFDPDAHLRTILRRLKGMQIAGERVTARTVRDKHLSDRCKIWYSIFTVVAPLGRGTICAGGQGSDGCRTQHHRRRPHRSWPPS